MPSTRSGLGPGTFLTGERVASKADLVNGPLKHAINVHETGASYVATSFVAAWTGTAKGVWAADAGPYPSCGSWDMNLSGVAGRPTNVNDTWTNGGVLAGCNESYHLYCFEK